MLHGVTALPDTPATAAGLAVLQGSVGRLQATSSYTSESSGGPSLTASTPAGQDLPYAASASGASAGDSAGSSGFDSGRELLAATPARVAHDQLQVDAASPPELPGQQSSLPAGLTRQQQASSSRSSRSSLAAMTPAAAFAGSTTAPHSSQHGPSQPGLSLVSSTPAAAQQADMQQLMQQMQDMLLAATTPAVQSSQPLPAQQQQQDEEQGLQGAGGTAAAADARKPAGKQQRSQKQKQPKQKPERKKQASSAAAAAPCILPAPGDDVGSGELQRQVQEQAGLAEQHYQAWLQRQAQEAEEAAAAELQALELEASADAALTPLQQMLKACGQQVMGLLLGQGGGGVGVSQHALATALLLTVVEGRAGNLEWGPPTWWFIQAVPDGNRHARVHGLQDCWCCYGGEDMPASVHT